MKIYTITKTDLDCFLIFSYWKVKSKSDSSPPFITAPSKHECMFKSCCRNSSFACLKFTVKIQAEFYATLFFNLTKITKFLNDFIEKSLEYICILLALVFTV